VLDAGGPAAAAQITAKKSVVAIGAAFPESADFKGV
jgi:hypothetical protein